MLSVINLYVVDKIFEEVAEVKIGAMAKMLYINCLTHHFKGKAANVTNATAFELFEEDFKDYKKFKPFLQELHKAGIVTISDRAIIFNNVWGKYINRELLTKVSPEQYVGNFQFNPISKYKEQLYANKNLVELSMLKYKVTEQQVKKLIDLFVKEQETFEKTYPNFGDCIKHCSYWISMNSQKIPKEIVKSNGKILGL